MIQPTTKPQLKALLISSGIDISGWGKGGTKSLDNLWQEIVEGDSQVFGAPLYRSLAFVQVIIRKNGRLLIETEQLFTNGAVRRRNRPLSEKMQPGESVLGTALRGLEQELGLPSEQIAGCVVIGDAPTIEQPSSSYPGLMTQYTVHTVEAIVSGLPDDDFSSDESSPGDPVRTHYWAWVPEGEAFKLI